MQLIDDCPPERRPAAVREALEVLPDLALFRVAAQATGAFGAWLDLGAALLTRLELDPVLREIAILQLARDEECEYERSQHAAIGLSVGLTQDQIDDLRSGATTSLDGAGRLVARSAHQFVLDGRVAEPTIRELREVLGERGVVELLMVLGHYLAIARLTASVQLAPDRADHIRPRDVGNGS